MLKPQDVYALVGLQVALNRDAERHVAQVQLATLLGISASETHAALARLAHCQLLGELEPGLRRPLARNAVEFLGHGLRYVFPPEFGPPTRGLPTGASAWDGQLASEGPPLVWPLETVRWQGPALIPLYRSVPAACLASRDLHLAMASVDMVRIGRPRERDAGLRNLTQLFGA